MAKCLIVYFSQMGSTKKVAESIARGLIKKGNFVDFQNLKEGIPKNIENYDLIGLGSPTYYFQPPFIVENYLKKLPSLKGKPFFIFVLHGAYKGRTGNKIRDILEKKEAKEIDYFFCKGSDVVYFYVKEGYLYSPDSPTKDDLKMAERFGEKVYENFVKNNYRKPERDKDVPSIIFRIERFLANQWLTRNFYSRFFKVDKKKCIRCGKCIKNCSVKNIQKDREGYPVWGRRCINCLMCEMNCPKKAIRCAFDWKIFSPFIKYNLNYYKKDKSLKYIKVKLKNGRIEKT